MSTIAGSKNTLLGYGSQLPNAAASNQIVIGTQAETTHIAGGGVIISQASLTLSGNTSLTVSGNAGISGQFLVSGGAGSAPYWGPALPGQLTGTSWTLANPLSNLYTVQGDGTNSWNLALPNPASAAGSSTWVKNMASASGAVSPSIVNQGSTNAVRAVIMMQGDSASFLSDGASWYVTSASENLATDLKPTITYITPVAGPLTAGTAVTISGTNFLDGEGLTVSIGSNLATGVVIKDTKTLTAIAPESIVSGPVNVVIEDSYGQATLANAYEYDPIPTFTFITPEAGPLTAGTAVTISGTGFINNGTGLTVSIGGNLATINSIEDTTTIKATAPAGTAGAKDVVISNPGGTATGTAAYTYDAVPTIVSLSQAEGPAVGENPITIVGTNFTSESTVAFGANPGTVIGITETTEIVVTVPPGTGTVQVTVSTPGGTTNGQTYTYVPAPTVTGISPSYGAATGLTSVTITGTNFTGATVVTVGANAVSSVVIAPNGLSLTAVTGTGTAGPADVVVTTAGGSGTGPGIYTYEGIPVVNGVTPTYGPIAGGTQVTITGISFLGTTGVTIGGVPTTFTVTNDTNISASTGATGAGNVGLKDIIVTTPIGPGTGSQLYAYETAPTVTAISPSDGPVTGNQSVTITGTSLLGTTTVSIGGVSATSVTPTSYSSLTAITGTTTTISGIVDVTATSPLGTGTGTSLYTYVNTPVVTSVSPSTGNMSGNTVITIVGRYFSGATTVTIGGTAIDFTVTNDTTISAVTPPNNAGSASIIVTTIGGPSLGTTNFTYANISPAKFTFTNTTQTFTVPASFTNPKVTVAGSVGGNNPGNGCTISATLQILPQNTILHIVSGGNNTYGGGGYGFDEIGGGSNGSGGGYSAILLNVTSTWQPATPSDIIIIAGGGGGGTSGKGGAGGYTSGGGGGTGGGGTGGGGGTQTQGGAGGTSNEGTAPAGGQYYGGNALQYYGFSFGGAGGGGYYGGGGADRYGGGGGSSRLNTTYATLVSSSDGSNAGLGYVTISWG